MIRPWAPHPLGRVARSELPPLSVVPLLIVVGIGLIVYLGLAFGALGFVAALVVSWWLRCKADAYVLSRDSDED